MSVRGAFLSVMTLASVAVAGCDGASRQPAAPPDAPVVTRISITGLPDPIIYDLPPAVSVGKAYTLRGIATLLDGTTAEIRAGGATWTSSDPSLVSFEGSILHAHQAGSATIRVTVPGSNVNASREVTIYRPGVARQDRAERVDCGSSVKICDYPACPKSGGPFWLFPVYESGTVELISVRNPGWGSPSNYVVQLSKDGEYLQSWLLLPTREDRRRASIPGGSLYAFTMSANLGPCGDVSASWTHPY